jgi:hypothetical protein
MKEKRLKGKEVVKKTSSMPKEIELQLWGLA